MAEGGRLAARVRAISARVAEFDRATADKGAERVAVLRAQAVRAPKTIGTWWSIIAGAALAILGAWQASKAGPCPEFHVAVELAGSDRRLGEWIPACTADLQAAHRSLAWDFVLIAGYVTLMASLLRRWWSVLRTPSLRSVMGAVVLLPVVGGALDVLENTLIWMALDVQGGRFAYPSSMRLPIVIATASWLKWILLVASGFLCLGVGFLAACRRGEESLKLGGKRDVPDHHPAPEDSLGISCSGGGIRAAAFSLGVLERLEAAKVTSRARWLTAVSGGAYAATAWRLLDHSGAPDAASTAIGWLKQPIPGSPAGRHRFLRNGPGGLGRPAFAAISYIAFNIAALGLLVYCVAWPVGWLLGSNAVQPGLRQFDRLPSSLALRAEQWLPGLLLLAIAGLVLAISSLPLWSVANLWRASAALVGVAAVLELLLVGIPLAMVAIGGWLSDGTAGVRPSAVGGSALVGVAATVWRLVSKPLVGRISSHLSQLGGVLLVIVALVWGGKVATDAAVGAGAFREQWHWLAAMVFFGLIYVGSDLTQISIHRVYRKRLRRTFGLKLDPPGKVHSPRQSDQLVWTDLTGEPELVICCAQQRTGIAPGGLPAQTFTISPTEVRIGNHVVETGPYLETMECSRGFRFEQYVSSWMATSGAAFASAMGRMSKGSTNALMAALNIDLGIWLPNPRYAHAPRSAFPKKVRLTYLFKEIFGRYDEADRLVFVADGGHWENLGLIELLRKRCATIICIDASGDDAFAFTTLRQAVELASLELPDHVAHIELSGLDEITPPVGQLAPGIVATLAVAYREQEGTTSEGVIYYAKAQLASNSDIALRQFAKGDPRFPNYSTGDQFLSDKQFENLVALGNEAGDRVVELLGVGGQPSSPSAPPNQGPGARENNGS